MSDPTESTVGWYGRAKLRAKIIEISTENKNGYNTQFGMIYRKKNNLELPNNIKHPLIADSNK